MNIKSNNLEFSDGARYAREYMKSVKELKQRKAVSYSQAVKMIDEESDAFGDYKEYYESNRLNILRNLFYI